MLANLRECRGERERAKRKLMASTAMEKDEMGTLVFSRASLSFLAQSNGRQRC